MHADQEKLASLTTAYNDIDVWRVGKRIDFDVVGATHATWHPQRLLTGMAWDALAAGCLLHPRPESARILMLGLGGGTVLRQIRRLLPEARLTAVEIDTGMIGLAREYMRLEDLDVQVTAGDGYAYIDRMPGAFDIIIDDIYQSGSEDVHRPAEVNAGLLRRVCGGLNASGILVSNLVTGPGHRTMQSHARKAYRTVFPDIRSIRPPDSLNEILVGGRNLRPPRVIRAAGAAWCDPEDRRHWARLRVTRLVKGPRHPSPGGPGRGSA